MSLLKGVYGLFSYSGGGSGKAHTLHRAGMSSHLFCKSMYDFCNKKYTSFKESSFLKTFLFVNILKLKMIIYCKLTQTDF